MNFGLLVFSTGHAKKQPRRQSCRVFSSDMGLCCKWVASEWQG
jgi:hypothetical protein